MAFGFHSLVFSTRALSQIIETKRCVEPKTGEGLVFVPGD